MDARKCLKSGWLCLLASLVGAVGAEAQTLSAENRYGAQFNEWFVRGDAAVSASPVLPQGVRLAAWDGQNENEVTRVAVAAAVYFFQVPPGAAWVRVDVGYRVDPAAQNAQVAGFLFVRNPAAEGQLGPPGGPAGALADEPAFVGDTYLLPGHQTQLNIYLPAAERVVNGVLEVHLTAGAGQVFDAQYVQVTSFGPDVVTLAPIIQVASDAYIADPYQYSYYYYYTGPNYWLNGGYFAQFVCFDRAVSPFYGGGWAPFRAGFHARHPWVHRPHHYVHRPPIVARPPVFATPAVLRHQQSWLSRQFGVDAGRYSDPQITALARTRVRVVSADEMRGLRERAGTPGPRPTPGGPMHTLPVGPPRIEAPSPTTPRPPSGITPSRPQPPTLHTLPVGPPRIETPSPTTPDRPKTKWELWSRPGATQPPATLPRTDLPGSPTLSRPQPPTLHTLPVGPPRTETPSLTTPDRPKTKWELWPRPGATQPLTPMAPQPPATLPRTDLPGSPTLSRPQPPTLHTLPVGPPRIETPSPATPDRPKTKWELSPRPGATRPLTPTAPQPPATLPRIAPQTSITLPQPQRPALWTPPVSAPRTPPVSAPRVERRSETPTGLPSVSAPSPSPAPFARRSGGGAGPQVPAFQPSRIGPAAPPSSSAPGSYPRSGGSDRASDRERGGPGGGRRR